MKFRLLAVGALALSMAAFFAASPAIGQDGHEGHDHSGGGAGGDEMAAYMEMMKPGPHHAQLMKAVGDWEIHSKMWMDPSQPPMETKGTAHLESLLDGRFLSEVTNSTMMGMPWEGRGIFGFDNGTGKHIGTWFDSFGTMMMYFQGTCTDDCSVVTMTTDYFDPMTQSNKVMKSVTRRESEDKSVMELYDVAGGNDVKMAVITYTRKKA